MEDDRKSGLHRENMVITPAAKKYWYGLVCLDARHAELGCLKFLLVERARERPTFLASPQQLIQVPHFMRCGKFTLWFLDREVDSGFFCDLFHIPTNWQLGYALIPAVHFVVLHPWVHEPIPWKPDLFGNLAG